MSDILTDVKMPFCQGCGHGIIVKSLGNAIEQCGYSEKDIIIVSDIGCSGLVDPLFNTHSLHGLHGRAPALGVGVSLGLDNTSKKVIVIQGDGGVTIGLQHVLESARRNINMTLVVMNNLLYGMTGGQISGLSTQKFKEQRQFEVDVPPFDIIKLAHLSGAAFSARATSIKTFTDVLTDALRTDGFSIVELSSLCTSYAYKKLNDFQEVIEEAEILKNDRFPVTLSKKTGKSLFESLKSYSKEFTNNVNQRLGVIISGSAGGGVQSAATLLASAGIVCGLHSTMKGEYPVTVGTGFSIAEVIFSKTKINYTGLENPDIVILVSEDGLKVAKNRIKNNSQVIADISLMNNGLENLDKRSLVYGNFIQVASKKGAALCAIAYWLNSGGLLDLNALKSISNSHRLSAELLKTIDDSGKVTINNFN
ncbi:MAG: 2-oxoacid:acceptor oxidoreductase family protein [Saprospiraceae bacterium]|nr:2-oxoacid:acceptor oxidoreductase family protein [Saprospiraceae bacterium]